MKEKFSIARIKEIVGTKFSMIFMVLFTIQAMLFLFSAVFRVSNLWALLASAIIVPLFYMLGKDQTDKEVSHTSMRFVKISITMFVASILNHGVVVLSQHVDASKQGSLYGLTFLIVVFVTLLMFGLFKREKVQEKLKAIEEQSVFDFLNLTSNEFEPTVGDIKIAINKDTGQDVYIPHKDRFLHMLILGPTGSGKTSQSIIPMLLQDVQNHEAGITVIEPKADLAEKVFMMAKHYGRDAVYFNPILPDCPYFNPLHGEESDVIENMATTFKMLNPDSPQFFLDMNDNLVRNALKVLKRTMGNDATLIDMHQLISNTNNNGKKMVTAFSRITADTPELQKENQDIASYFANDYFAEKSKTFEHCSGLRSQVAKITSNKYLRRVLNPPAGKNDIDFDAHLANGGIITIATAQGTLRDLGRYLGFFIILQFQASVFRRPGNEFTRRPHFLYIDEFQVYANPGFADMLTQGRSYRVASHLATQNRALIGMGQGMAGRDFIELVSTNARNIIIYPAGNIQDAEYYSKQFGTIIERTVQKGVSKKKWNPLLGMPDFSQPTETVREVEEEVPRFSASDIIYRPFGEITYLIIKNNSVQEPSVGLIEYIPKDVNETLDVMIQEYNEEQHAKAEAQKPHKESFDDTTSISQAHQDVVKKAVIPNLEKEYITTDDLEDSLNEVDPLEGEDDGPTFDDEPNDEMERMYDSRQAAMPQDDRQDDARRSGRMDEPYEYNHLDDLLD